jgi:TonB family protein
VRSLVVGTGVLFVVIDERGSVESAIITEPLERTYDRMVLAAARTWTYQPAMRNGASVKHRTHARLRAALARIASARKVVRPSPYWSMLCLKRSSLSYIDASPRCIVWLHG